MAKKRSVIQVLTLIAAVILGAAYDLLGAARGWFGAAHIAQGEYDTDAARDDMYVSLTDS